jgi:16S rRNA (guanine527-N7)-methyltransferase
LGSGAGIPGLPLALIWPESEWVLLDGSANRAEFLRETVVELGVADRVHVVGERAEIAGRGPLRGAFDLVVARSFAGPAPTAECGSPFLRPGGRLVVAEPPGGRPERWDAPGLAQLGLQIGKRGAGRTAYQVLVQVDACPDRFPRRVGVPAKRPLF